MEISPIPNSQTSSAMSGSSASSDIRPHGKVVPPATNLDSSTSASASSPSANQVKQATDQINKVVQGLDRNLQFVMDQQSGKIVVQVMDIENKKVIQQIPSEEALAISQALDKLQGLLIRQKA